MKISKYYFALAVLLFLAAAALIAYPLVSNYTSVKYASQIRTEHYAAVAELDDGRIKAELQRAWEYNALLASGVAQTFSVVCLHFGIETDERAFAYIAGWNSDKELNELKASLDTICTTAGDMIAGIESRMPELCNAEEQPSKKEECVSR